MYNANRLKIGLFGANCSSGRAVTMVPERWSGSWADNVRLARMADQAGQADESYGVRINPPKSEEVRFGPSDRVIVVSEN